MFHLIFFHFPTAQMKWVGICLRAIWK